jgi:calcium-dependent protein kinase
MGACNSASKNPKHHLETQTKINNTSNSTGHLEVKQPPKVPIDKISIYTKYDDITNFYKFGANKGFGSFGIVREAFEKESGQKFAIKTVWKAQFTDKKKFIIQEIEILLQVEHESIIKCYQVYEDQTSIHFVFDLVEGGDLFEYLTSIPEHVIPDTRAVDFFNQILDALMYLHDKHIIHRDIKPENFLIYHTGNQIKLKLIDFGFATIIKDDEKLNDKLGSLIFFGNLIFLY